MKLISVGISGMHCGHCVASVRDALSALPGVAGHEVRLGNADVRFDDARCSTASILQTIRSAGSFEITGFRAA